MATAKNPWNSSRDELLIDLKDRLHSSWAVIGSRLGRRPSECAQRYGVLNKIMRSGPIKSVKEIEATKYDPAMRQRIDAAAALIDARLERDHRALMRGDFTPVFFGDPPPGRSALDQKMA